MYYTTILAVCITFRSRVPSHRNEAKPPKAEALLTCGGPFAGFQRPLFFLQTSSIISIFYFDPITL